MSTQGTQYTHRRRHAWTAVIAALVLMAAACRDREPAAAAPAVASTDRWLGQWNGPEGTFLQLSRSGDKLVVKIQSLDGAASYDGVAVGDRIEFQRDGKTASIRAGTGQQTGMKWLADKSDCLIVQTGEGYCR